MNYKWQYLWIPIIYLLLCSCGQASSLEYKDQSIQVNGDLFYVDLDGDNVEDSVSLATNGNSAILSVNNQSVSIPLEGLVTEQDTLNPHPVYEEPLLHLLNDKTTGTKMILLSVVWNTNKIGTKAELWLYEYSSDQLNEVWVNERNDEGLDYRVSDYNSGYVNLEIPQFSFSTQIPIDKDYYESYLNTHLEGTIDEVASGMYYIKDYNNDQIPELMIETILSTGASEWLPFSSVFEIYTMKNGTLDLIKVIPNKNSYKDVSL